MNPQSAGPASVVRGMLNINAIADAPLSLEPFEHFIARDVVSAESIETLAADCPSVKGTGSFPVPGLKAGPAFHALLDQLQSPAFADAVGGHFGFSDLHAMPQLITYRGKSGPKDGSVHTDSESKLITVLLYLNPTWDQPGGRLRLLRSDRLDDVAAEVPPTSGTLVAFRRSAKSFHGHEPCSGERRLVQVNWVADESYVTREERRHRRSAVLKSLLGFGSQ